MGGRSSSVRVDMGACLYTSLPPTVLIVMKREVAFSGSTGTQPAAAKARFSPPSGPMKMRFVMSEGLLVPCVAVRNGSWRTNRSILLSSASGNSGAVRGYVLAVTRGDTNCTSTSVPAGYRIFGSAKPSTATPVTLVNKYDSGSIIDIDAIFLSAE